MFQGFFVLGGADCGDGEMKNCIVVKGKGGN